MAKNKTINVRGTEITIISVGSEDYISLTDMIKPFGDETIIKNWLRNRNTVEFLGIWEQINNPGFNPVEFDLIKKQTGLNSFVLRFAQREFHSRTTTTFYSNDDVYS